MNYQNIACWGDSQTFGARSYGCYPLYLAQKLNASTRYRWRALNYSTNGHRARDLWFRLNHELVTLDNVYQACLLIGANDVGNGTPVKLFKEYYQQSLDALLICGVKSIYIGEIPPIYPDGHAFFAKATAQRRNRYNEVIDELAEYDSAIQLVRFRKLNGDCYCDPVHFNERGNRRVAKAFAKAIMSY